MIVWSTSGHVSRKRLIEFQKSKGSETVSSETLKVMKAGL
jgi:hypothetical protein